MDANKFSELPDEVLLLVLHFLPVADQSSCSLVCKRLARLGRDRNLRRLHQAKLLWLLHTGDLIPISLMHTATTVKLPWLHVRPSINEVLSTLSGNKLLESLDASHCYDLSTSVISHIKKMRNLRHLDVSCNKRLNNDDVLDLLLSLRHLDRLVLRKCVHLNDAALVLPPTSFATLREIDIRGCPEITGKFLESADLSLPFLKSVSLYRITDNVASRFADSLPFLEELVAQNAHELSDTGFGSLVRLQSLSTIKLYHCWRITSRSLELLNNHLPNLKGLVLKGNRSVNPDFSQMAAMTNLCVLRLSWKSTLSSADLIRMAGMFKSLTKLNLSGCHHIDDDALLLLSALPLTILKLLDVPLITDRGFNVILELPRLVKLVTGWTLNAPAAAAAGGTILSSSSSSSSSSSPSNNNNNNNRDVLGMLGWRSSRASTPSPSSSPPSSPRMSTEITPIPLRLNFLQSLSNVCTPHLTILRLHHNGNKSFLPRAAAMAAICQLRTLQELHLCGWGVTDEDTVLIACLKNLTVLVLSASEISSKGLRTLGENLRALYRLDLRLSLRLICQNGDGLNAFSGQRPLHTLILSGCTNLHPTALRAISRFSNLHCLDLTLSRIRSFDLRLLVPLTTLRRLVLSGCVNITVVEALRVLHHAQHLHTIDLLGCAFEPDMHLRERSSIQLAQFQWDYLKRPFVKVLAETHMDPSRNIEVSPYV